MESEKGSLKSEISSRINNLGVKTLVDMARGVLFDMFMSTVQYLLNLI